MIKVVVLAQTLIDPLEIVAPWDQMQTESLNAFCFWKFGGVANYHFGQAIDEFMRAVPI